MPIPALRCHNIKKSFTHLPVVRGLSFSIAQGEILALLGPSGCGKTTTLRLVAGFERLDGGQIEIAGRVVADQ
ncbi:MAG TPA: ATP-binding cassette domain-containing protein, partial [Anaerolineae bacterium]|nr:ATP-binding cassette domain-containing protein [Anaerolineae bacterium]